MDVGRRQLGGLPPAYPSGDGRVTWRRGGLGPGSAPPAGESRSSTSSTTTNLSPRVTLNLPARGDVFNLYCSTGDSSEETATFVFTIVFKLFWTGGRTRVYDPSLRRFVTL